MTEIASRQIPAHLIHDIQRILRIEGGAQETLFIRAINTGWIVPVDTEGRPVKMTLERLT